MSIAVVSLRATALVLVAAVLAAGAFLFARRNRPSPSEPTPALIAQTRVDALAGVAKRIYFQEVYGSADASAFRVMSVLPGLVHGLETGDLRLARRTLDQVPVRHAVHERVMRGRHMVLDVGLKFVVAGQKRTFRAPNGRYLGQIEISVQDVIGYVKLFHRLTGAEIVVDGRKGHAKTSLATSHRLTLPARGRVQVDGASYWVSSFVRTGFGGELLRVWVLDPTG